MNDGPIQGYERVTIRQMPTGVPGLDEILGGGLPEYSFNIIAGAPGCGKTTLAHQFLFANASPERPAVYFTIWASQPSRCCATSSSSRSSTNPEQQSQSIRDINEALIVSSVRQHELTEQAQKAETALRESEERLSMELAATEQLQEASTQLIREDNVEVLYEHILDAAVAVMRSEFASIQTLYPERGPDGELGLLGYRGFNPPAAQFWEWVRPTSESACGIALRTGQRVIISDVQTSDLMAGTEDQAVCLQTASGRYRLRRWSRVAENCWG